MKKSKVNEGMPKILREAEIFLRKHGYIPFVLGGISIEMRPPLKYNFRLVIDFTGKKFDVERPAKKKKK